jgi:hypothetical protein
MHGAMNNVQNKIIENLREVQTELISYRHLPSIYYSNRLQVPSYHETMSI